MDDDPEDEETADLCHYCGGEGSGIIGTDWDCEDPVNGPYNNDIEECPCCHGSGLAKDCTFW